MNKAICLIFFLLLLAGSFTTKAQAGGIQNIVFEGVGIRGIAYSGAIKELQNNNVLPEVKRVGGTSAGAITALMIALGYTAEEVTTIISETNFKKFNDGKFSIAGGANRLKNYFGWYRGNKLHQWLANIVQAKTGDANITFLQLKQKGFKDLYVTGTNLSEQQLVVFSHESYPSMRVIDAVRISISIPIYFEPVFMDNKGQIIHHPKSKKVLSVMVDGGFTGNFPIKIFDSTKYMAAPVTNAFAINHQTIGFRIDNEAQVGRDTADNKLAPMPTTNIKQYATAFYTIIIENLNRQTLTKEDWNRTVSISDSGIGPRIRKLSAKEIYTLTENGRNAAARYLTTLYK